MVLLGQSRKYYGDSCVCGSDRHRPAHLGGADIARHEALPLALAPEGFARPLGAAAAAFYRPFCVGLTLLFAAFGVFVLATLATSPEYASLFGVDRGIYLGATERWLAGGPFYYPEQVAGPYELMQGHVLYPPIALWFFVPASFLPALLWWAIPLSIIAAVMAHHRPEPWAWPMIAACLGFHWSVMILATGNPTLWLSAAVALGTLRGGWAVAVLAKPTLFPFALVGAHRRRWWLALGLFALACVPFGLAMWSDWFAVVTNARSHGGPLYSLGDVPWLLAPVLAWIAGRSRPAARPRAALSLRGRRASVNLAASYGRSL